VLKNGLYNAIGGVVRIGLALVAVPVLIRLIGIEDYGVWTLSSSVIGLATLAEGGISVSTTFFLSKDIANDDRVGISETLTATFAAMLTMATAASLFFYFGSEFFASLFHNLKGEYYIQVIVALKVGSLVLWARLLQQHLVGLMQAYEKYSLINILSTIQNTISTLGLIVVASVGGRTVEMMKYQAIISIGVLVAYFIASKRVVNYAKPHFLWNRFKGVEIFRYSSVAWAGSLGSALFTQGDRLIVGSILDVKSLGIYSAIANVVSQINTLSALPISPLLPTIAKYSTQKNVKNTEIEKPLKQGLQMNAIIAFGLGSLIILMADRIVKIIIGNNFSMDSVYALQIGGIIYSIYSLNAVGYYVLYALGKTKICTSIHLSSAILSLILIALLSMKLGLIGAVLGNFGYIVTSFMTILSLKILNIKMVFLFKCLAFPTIWLFITVLVGLAFQGSHELVRILIYLVEVFIVLIWFMQSNSIKLRMGRFQ
jgi:O-antigen/teichoic acid export membrane protein